MAFCIIKVSAIRSDATKEAVVEWDVDVPASSMVHVLDTWWELPLTKRDCGEMIISWKEEVDDDLSQPWREEVWVNLTIMVKVTGLVGVRFCLFGLWNNVALELVILLAFGGWLMDDVDIGLIITLVGVDLWWWTWLDIFRINPTTETGRTGSSPE